MLVFYYFALARTRILGNAGVRSTTVLSLVAYRTVSPTTMMAGLPMPDA